MIKHRKYRLQFMRRRPTTCLGDDLRRREEFREEMRDAFREEIVMARHQYAWDADGRTVE